MFDVYKLPEHVEKEIENFQLTKDESDMLIDEFIQNNIDGKTTMAAHNFTGFFKAISKNSNYIIGNVINFCDSIDLMSSDYSILSINDGWDDICHTKTLMYQSSIWDNNGVRLCEGDIFYYKKHFRYVVAYKNGSTVDFRFKRLREKSNPMYLSDLRGFKCGNKIIRVGNIFDNYL